MGDKSTPKITNPLGRIKKHLFIYPSTPIDFKYPHIVIGSMRYHKDWYEVKYLKEDI